MLAMHFGHAEWIVLPVAAAKTKRLGVLFKAFPAESLKRRDFAITDATIIGFGSDDETLTFGNRALCRD